MTCQTREVAKKMIEGGWRVVPIKPREKAPDGGNEWQEKTFTPECFQETNGIGIMTGHGVLALDIDSYDPEVSKAIADEAKRRFGKTLERVGQSPKTALFYRGLEGRKKTTVKLALSGFVPQGKMEAVEVLGAGNQCVAFGVHPDTGQPYKWAGLEPWDSFLGVVECLPEVTEPDLQAFLDWVQTNHGKPKLSEQIGRAHV